MEIYKNKSHVLVHHVFPKTVSSCFSLSRKTHQINCSTGAFELQFSGPSWTSEVLTSDAQTSRRSNKELDPIQPQSVEAVRWNLDFRLPLAMPSQPCERQKHTHTQNHIIDFKQKPPWQQFLSIKVGWITHKPPNFPSAKPTLFHVNAALVMVTLSKKHLTSWHRCSRAPLAQQLRQGQGQEKQRARCNCCDNLLGFSLKEFQLKKKWWNASQSGG